MSRLTKIYYSSRWTGVITDDEIEHKFRIIYKHGLEESTRQFNVMGFTASEALEGLRRFSKALSAYNRIINNKHA